MRVAIVTESFPPDVNGVAHCALRTAEHLARRGHEPLVVAPAGPHDQDPGPDPCPVIRVPSLPLPGYPQVRVALPGRRTAAAIAAHRAELVHLASPFVLGVRGLAAATRLREIHGHGAAVLLVLCSRLSPEKRPGTALETLAHLRGSGVDAALVVAGEGPLRARLTTQAGAARLPVTFLGHVPDRADLAALLATADVALAPGPVETFGLVALEALACGTPVVASARSALPALIGPAGGSAHTPGEYAAAVRRILAGPVADRRAMARTRAELYTWPAAVNAFLTAHRAAAGGVAPAGRRRAAPESGGVRS